MRSSYGLNRFVILKYFNSLMRGDKILPLSSELWGETINGIDRDGVRGEEHAY